MTVGLTSRYSETVSKFWVIFFPLDQNRFLRKEKTIINLFFNNNKQQKKKPNKTSDKLDDLLKIIPWIQSGLKEWFKNLFYMFCFFKQGKIMKLTIS